MTAEDEEEFQTRKEQRAARKAASARDRSKFKKTNRQQREEKAKQVSQQRLAKKELCKGRVIAIFPEGIQVEHNDEIYLCVLRGVLKFEWTQLKNLITVGDFVLFEPETNYRGSIAHIEERHSVLSRQDHLRRRHKQLIAANIDQVLITVSLVKPPLKPSLVDRYIIATYKGGMEPVIVINKIDLLEPNEEALFKLFVQTYRQLKIPLIATSTVTAEGIQELQDAMKDKASVFAGQSGVGKSSLINLLTGRQLPIGEVVAKTKKGSHTTTNAQLIPLTYGGWCIDTPGIRSFGIWDLQKEDLNLYFSELSALSTRCHYPNCTHSHEPGCALEEALIKGEVSPLRIESYLKLLHELSHK